jgi:hypothetical protein
MEDVEDLASKMMFVLDNPTAAKVLSENGERYANIHFSQEAFNSSFIDIINGVLYR